MKYELSESPGKTVPEKNEVVYMETTYVAFVPIQKWVCQHSIQVKTEVIYIQNKYTGTLQKQKIICQIIFKWLVLVFFSKLNYSNMSYCTYFIDTQV